VDGSLFYLAKARARGEIPSVTATFNHSDFGNVNKHPDFVTILFEELEHCKERVSFEEDLRAKISSKPIDSVVDLMASVSLASDVNGDMSQSVLMQSALTRSTLNFLTSTDFGISINWKAFFQPVMNPHSEASKRLEDRMHKMKVKYSPNKIPGDGNCQMHSLSDQLCGNLKHHQHIRRKLVAWLRSHSKLTLPNGATLEQFSGDSWGSYCDSMQKQGIWGDHLTLIAAAEMFKLKIVIISSVPGDNYVIEIVPVFSPPQHTIYLSHLAEFHYSSVVPIVPHN